MKIMCFKVVVIYIRLLYLYCKQVNTQGWDITGSIFHNGCQQQPQRWDITGSIFLNGCQQQQTGSK
jgi:hypothetical protein